MGIIQATYKLFRDKRGRTRTGLIGHGAILERDYGEVNKLTVIQLLIAGLK